MKLIVERDNFGFTWEEEDDKGVSALGGGGRQIKVFVTTLKMNDINLKPESLKKVNELEIDKKLILERVSSLSGINLY